LPSVEYCNGLKAFRRHEPFSGRWIPICSQRLHLILVVKRTIKIVHDHRVFDAMLDVVVKIEVCLAVVAAAKLLDERSIAIACQDLLANAKFQCGFARVRWMSP
jgi:hypothetical protein